MINYIKVLRVYRTHNNKNLRARLLIESENSCQSHIVKINKRHNSALSLHGYGIIVTGIDFDLQTVNVTFFSNEKKIPTTLNKINTMVLF